MTTVTYRWLASYTVHDHEDIAVRVVTGWDRDEPLDDYDRYEVVRTRRVSTGGGTAFTEDRLLAYDTEDEAQTKARALCIEGRSAIPGAFCFLEECPDDGDDEPLPYLDPHPALGHLPTVYERYDDDGAEEAYWRRLAIGGDYDDDHPTI